MAKTKYRYLTLGKNIKELRENHHLTQRELANQLHINPTAVSAWEIGRTRPGIDTAAELANIFNVEVNRLYKGVPDSELKRQLHFKNQQRYRSQIADGLMQTNKQKKYDDIDKALRAIISYHGRMLTEKDRRVLANIIRGYLDGQD